MVTYKDLRINNNLQNKNGDIFTVLALENSNKLLVESKKEGLQWLMLYYDLFGIPLWDGILEKAGFVDEQVCWNFDRSEELGHHFIDFSISKYNETQIKFWRGDTYCGIIHCEFFHELQNLAWAVEKLELSIS